MAIRRGVDAHAVFLAMLKGAGLPTPERETKVVPERRFRFDYCWPAHKLALECDGGVFSGGRHVRPTGFLRDCEKLNLAAVAGYRILRVTPQQLPTTTTLALVRAALTQPNET